MEDDIPAIVIDSGSGTCKAGFSGDDGPRSVFSSVVGTPRFRNEDITIDNVVGKPAQCMREFLCMKYPIDRGIVTNWDDAEKIWDFCFKDLHVDSSAQPVFMSEPVLNPNGNREHMAECMFEKFNVPAYFAQNSATLALFTSGRGIGLILDVGHGVTHAVPIHYTSKSPLAVYRQELGGRDVTMYLQKLLYDRGYSFTTTAELELVREIKEKLCYTSLDYQHSLSMPVEDTEVTLPDGNKIAIGNEKFQCGECLFQPAFIGQKHLKGLHELLQSCIENCDIDIRRDFYCSVILAGGASVMPNLEERLDKLWKKSVPPKMVSRVVAPIERKYSVWMGGSIVSSMSTFQQAWVKKEEYEEFGPTIIHRRFV